MAGGRWSAAPGPLARAVAALTATQIVGWGTTYHVPAVLSGRIGAGLGMSASTVFVGLTLMLVVAGALSPLAGRLLGRDGARPWLTIGSCLVALGLGAMAAAPGPATFVLGWAVLGVAMPFALTQGASTALVQISPGQARRAITFLSLFSGFSSTIAWPVLIALDAHLGWRATLAVCAAANLACALVNHVGLSPKRGTIHDTRVGAPPPIEPAAPPPRGTFALAALCFSLSGVLTWGLPLHMIGVLEDLGHDETTAVWVGAMLGPGQVLARAFELAGGQRYEILTIGIVSSGLMLIALVSLLAFGSSLSGAIGFSVGYGLSAGLVTIVRAVAPLRLFGTASYATVLGRLGLPQNIAFACAPFGFALVREHLGATILIEGALAIGIVCLWAIVLLKRRAPPLVPIPALSPAAR